MDKSLIGIEIGHKNIKIIYGIKRKKLFEINLYQVIPLEDKTIEDGNLLDSKILTEIISKFIRSNEIKTKNVVLNIQSTLIITRRVVIPKIKNDELEKLIAFQKQEYFPINISDYRIDYKINIQNQDNYEIMLIAVPNSFINTYIDLFKSLNLNILNIDINSNSLVELFKSKEIRLKSKEIRLKSKQVIAVVDIGYKTTDLTIIDGERILFSRIILYGITQLNNILNELSKYLSFYYSKFKDILITKLYLIGGGSYSKDIDKDIKSVFNSEVVVGTDLDIITQLHNKDILYFINLIGLLNKNYKDKFNLLPDWYLDELKNKTFKKSVISKSVVAISLLAIFFTFTNIIIIQKEKFLTNINLKLNDDKFSEVNLINDKLVLTQNELDKQKNILYSIEKNSISTNNLLNTIIDCSPNKVYLNTISIDNDSKHIGLSGIADKNAFNQILEFSSNLDDIKLFENIDFNIPFKDKSEILSFTIEFDIVNVLEERIKNAEN